MPEERQYYLWVLIAVMFLLMFFLIPNKGSPQRQDEIYHIEQIKMFQNDNFNKQDDLAILPGYHSILYILMEPFNLTSLFSARIITTILSFASVVVFYYIAKEITPKKKYARTLQYAFLPITGTLFFMVYTDIVSVLFLLLTLLLMLKRKYALSGITSIISVWIRQNNIVLVLMLGLYVFYKTRSWKKPLFYLPSLIIPAYIYLSYGSFVAADSAYHKASTFSTGNIFFTLFLIFFFFLPEIIGKRNEIWKKIKSKEFLIALGVTALLYFWTYEVNHVWNVGSPHLKDQLAMWMDSSITAQIISFVVIMIALLFVWKQDIKLLPKSIFYSGSVMFLLPLSLISHRYILPCLVFFLLLREKSAMEHWTSTLFLLIFFARFVAKFVTGLPV